MYTYNIFFISYAILCRISILRPRKELIDILYKRPRNVLNNDHSIYIYRPSIRTNPPTRQR